MNLVTSIWQHIMTFYYAFPIVLPFIVLGGHMYKEISWKSVAYFYFNKYLFY